MKEVRSVNDWYGELRSVLFKSEDPMRAALGVLRAIQSDAIEAAACHCEALGGGDFAAKVRELRTAASEAETPMPPTVTEQRMDEVAWTKLATCPGCGNDLRGPKILCETCTATLAARVTPRVAQGARELLAVGRAFVGAVEGLRSRYADLLRIVQLLGDA